MLQVYAYVDGSDLDDIEGELVKRCHAFVASWNVGTARVVNDKYPRTSDLAEGDLPDWNIGMNFDASFISQESFDELISFLSQTAADTDREFVVGARRSGSEISEDLAFIGADRDPQNVQFLREQLCILR